jgi:hypothetical protein
LIIILPIVLTAGGSDPNAAQQTDSMTMFGLTAKVKMNVENAPSDDPKNGVSFQTLANRIVPRILMMGYCEYFACFLLCFIDEYFCCKQHGQ